MAGSPAHRDRVMISAGHSGRAGRRFTGYSIFRIAAVILVGTARIALESVHLISPAGERTSGGSG